MSKGKDDIIEKIRKLFRLSDSDNENEAALALANAERLMKKHNIEAIDLCEKIDIIELSYHEGRLLGWKNYLSQTVAELFFCKSGTSGRNIPQLNIKQKHIFVGTPGNVETAEEVYRRLVRWVNYKAKVNYPNCPVSVRNEYKNGIVYGIMRRVYDILKERRDSEESMALVPINDALEKHTEKWGTSKSSEMRAGEETINGVRDAIEAPIFQTIQEV